MLNQEKDVSSETPVTEPTIKEGKVIRWERTTPNGFQHWRIKSGVFQFTGFPKEDMALLEWGDSVQESHERGMIKYVNICQGCWEKFFHGTIILVPFYHRECEQKRYSESESELLDMLVRLYEDDPDAYHQLIKQADIRRKEKENGYR